MSPPSSCHVCAISRVTLAFNLLHRNVWEIRCGNKKKICIPRKRYMIDMQRASIILTRYYPSWGDTNGCCGKKQPELTNTTEEGRDYEEQHNFTRNPFQWYHFKCLCPPSHCSGQTGGGGGGSSFQLTQLD